MPELPEVQTICDVIRPQIVGKRIKSVCVTEEKILSGSTTAAFSEKLTGAAIIDMKRRGKYILFILSNNLQLTVHLRMTGCLLVAPKAHPMEKHTHVVFKMEDEAELRFSDQRKFGRMWLTEQGYEIAGMASLGPEPFDAAVTAAYLKEKLGKSQRKIKDCLLDQAIVAGIGNIYSDEILFRAAIHPGTKASHLTTEQYERLETQIPATMNYYVEKNRIDAEAYLKTSGREYRNTPYLQVYGRGGKPCLVCGEKLVKERIAGRGSVFCPRCQKLDGSI